MSKQNQFFLQMVPNKPFMIRAIRFDVLWIKLYMDSSNICRKFKKDFYFPIINFNPW